MAIAPSSIPEQAEQSGDDRRQYIRFPFSSSLVYQKKSGGNSAPTLCCNLSRKGIAFYATEDFSPGDNLKIEIKISGTVGDRTIPLETIIRWTRREGGDQERFNVGAEFVDAADSDVAMLIQAAIKDFDLQLSEAPENIWLLRFRGDAKRSLGDEKAAEADYMKADFLKNKKDK